MTVKQFFKSTSFKCIAALLSILLVCGIFLTVMYGLLEVTAGEKLQRSIAKVYPGMKVTVYGLDDDGNEVEIDEKVSNPKGFVSETIKYGVTAEVSEAYKVVFTENGEKVEHYLVTSKGLGGYDSGWVMCNVAVEVKDEKIVGIYKVSIQSNQGQSFINRVGEDALAQFSELYEDGISFSQDLITKATTVGTKNAICNAVNGALTFVRAEILGEEIIEIAYSDYINLDKTTFDKDARKFTVVTKDSLMPDAFTVEIVVTEDMKIGSYTVVENGTTASRYVMNPDILNGTLFVGKGLAEIEALIGNGVLGEVSSALKTSATESNFLCGNAAAFALANFQDYMDGKYGSSQPPVDDEPKGPNWDELAYTQYVDSAEFDKDTRTFTIVTKSLGGMPGKFTVEVKVAADKTVESFDIKVNGSTEGFEADMHTDILAGTFFNGKSLADIEALIADFAVGDEEIEGVDDELVTGATRSNFICAYACAFALANFEEYMPVSLQYEQYVDSAEFDAASGTFTIVTKSLGGMPGKFTVEVKVATDKTVESFDIKVNGSTEGFEADMHTDILAGTFFNGKSLAEIEALIADFAVGDEDIEGVDDELVTGATRSNFICAYACAYALANYDAYVGGKV